MIEDEATGFNMPDDTTTFLCPQSAPMTGFARTAPSYETPYKLDEKTGINGWGEGYTFPCLFRNSGIIRMDIGMMRRKVLAERWTIPLG